jgi:hypothetical protein
MIGEPLGRSARNGDDKYVLVAVVLAGESNKLAIGGKSRIGFNARPGREALGLAAGARDDPPVVGLGEDDVGFAPRRFLEQPGRGAFSGWIVFFFLRGAGGNQAARKQYGCQRCEAQLHGEDSLDAEMKVDSPMIGHARSESKSRQCKFRSNF